jgi:hypothetical protein
MQVIGGGVVRRTVGSMICLGGLQRRLDDAGDARRHLLLQFEDVL